MYKFLNLLISSQQRHLLYFSCALPASNTIYCDFENEADEPCPLSFVPDLGENEERWTVTDAASASQLADNTLNLGTLTFPLV